MIAVAYKPGHLDFMRIKEGTFESREAIEESLRELEFEALTLVSNNFIVGVLGITPKRKGVAEVWSILSEDIKLFPISSARAIKKILKQYEDKYNLIRVEMSVREDLLSACRFAKFLGFKQEGLMHRFGLNGENFYLFARTK
jgi:hypothetical protein